MKNVNQIWDQVIALFPSRRSDSNLTKYVSITAATALVLYSSYKIIASQKRKQSKGIKEIPSPRGGYFPYFGHMLSLGENPGKQVQKWHREVGHIFKLQMGIQTWIMLDDPVLAHKIYVTHGAQTSHRPDSNYTLNEYSLHGKGVAFIQPTKNWQKARSAVLSVISPKNVDDTFVDIINRETTALAKRLITDSRASKDGTDPFKHLHLNSMNIIFSTAFGKRYQGIDDPEFNELSDIINEQIYLGSLENDLSNFLPIFSIPYYFAGKHEYTKRFFETKRNPLFRGLIDEAAKKEGKNLVKSLEQYDLEDDDKFVLLSDLIAGGTDTVSITLNWVFAIMCNYPEVQKRAAGEVDQFIEANGRAPVFTDRDQFPYIISMLKECMRFKPTLPFGIPHLANEDILVDGYLIPKGTTIISSMESMHANSEVYSNPEAFIPERFLNNLKTMLAAANGKLEHRDHYNFGWGRRICPAIYLAEAELFISFIQVIARCTIIPVKDAEGKNIMPDIENTVTSGLVLISRPYKVNFVARPNALI